MNETIEIDLREIGLVLLKRIWTIMLCAVLVGAAVLVYTINFVAPAYKSSIKMYVNNNSSAHSQYISSSDRAVALSLVETYINMISSDTVMDKVAEATGLEISGAEIRGMMTAGSVGETEIFQVSIISPDPQLSADIANTIADVAPDELTRFITGSTAKIIDYARPATSRYSPNYVTNTILGVVTGAAIAVLSLVLQMVLDIHVKREEDLTKIFSVPVLGVIPELHEETEKRARRVRR